MAVTLLAVASGVPRTVAAARVAAGPVGQQPGRREHVAAGDRVDVAVLARSQGRAVGGEDGGPVGMVDGQPVGRRLVEGPVGALCWFGGSGFDPSSLARPDGLAMLDQALYRLTESVTVPPMAPGNAWPLSPTPGEDAPLDTRDAILAAAIDAAAVHGVQRLSMSDVAKAAGVSRPTLYRYFSSREDILAAALLREVSTLVTAVSTAVGPVDDPVEAIEVGVLVTLQLARAHPLLDRLIRTEPDTLVPLLVAEVDAATPSVMSVIRQTVDLLLGAKIPGLDDDVRRRLADMLTRLLVSYAVSAPDDPPELVAATVARVLAGGVLPDTRPLTASN
jgi:AcrR family transcriptional regulator